MPDFVTLTCPSCGGKLQITHDIDRFACSYCGAEHIVQRSGGIVSLAPVVEGLKQVAVGVDRTAAGVDRVAASLALPRLEADVRRWQSEVNSLTIKREQGWRGAGVYLVFGVLGLLLGIFRSQWLVLGIGAVLTVVGLILLAAFRSADQDLAGAQNVLKNKLKELWQTEDIVKGK